MAQKINRTWVKNRIASGELLVRCTGNYTDDYAFDNSNKFGKTDWKPANEVFNKENNTLWKMDSMYLWGEKEGVINGCFASCEWYEFKIKQL